MMANNILVGGIATPPKNDRVKVSWDDDIPFPTEWKNNPNVPVTTNQMTVLFNPNRWVCLKIVYP